jgi:hypothetical protein
MKAEEIGGLIALLFAVFIFGLLIKMEPIFLAILLVIGGLIFFVLYTKNNYAIFGVIVLIFALLLNLMYQTEINSKIIFSDYYLSTIVLFLIIIVGFLIAYKLLNQ